MYVFVMWQWVHNTIARQNVLRWTTHSVHVLWLNIRSMPLATFYHFSVHPCADLYYYTTVDVVAARDPMSRCPNVVLWDVLTGSVLLYTYIHRINSWPIFALFVYRFRRYFLFRLSCFQHAITTFKWRFHGSTIFEKHYSFDSLPYNEPNFLSAHI